MKRNAQSKSAGGPLKRTGKSAELWDEALGRSLDHLPSTQLPTKRSVLQKYRCLRIERPDEPTVDLASYIAAELIQIWNKARIPTVPVNGCNKRVVAAIELWYKHKNRPEKRLLDDFQKKLDQLLDLAPKPNGRGGNEKRELEFLKKLMRETGKSKKTGFCNDSDSDWEDDYDFYVDQYKVGFKFVFYMMSLENIFQLKKNMSIRVLCSEIYFEQLSLG